MRSTEFLLARIAEDEEYAAGQSPEPHGNYCEVITHGVLYYCSCSYPARMLAECEAKREIIKWFRVSEDSRLGSMPWQIMKKVLAALALPYADHPDYDPDWSIA